MPDSSGPYILPFPYFGPLTFYQRLHGGHAIIDIHEHYLKQSLRNRCEILGPNGRQALSIPVVHRSGSKIPFKDVRVDYRESWQKDHWGAIRSSYGRAPFFIHFASNLESLFHNRPEYLLDWNQMCHEVVCSLLRSELPLTFSKEYLPPTFGMDERPKYRKAHLEQEAYIQVFSDRYPFQSGLSILDMLFCLGPETRDQITS